MRDSHVTTWNLDVPHSTLGFSVKHLMVANVRGAFTAFSGTLKVDAERPEGAQVEVSVEVASIDTRMPQRDEHLRSEMFFDAGKHPRIEFRSTSAVKRGDGYEVTGSLRIRDRSHDIVLHVDGVSGPVQDMHGGTRVGLSATGKIDRRDFGLTWNKALEAGGVVVGEEVKLQIDAEFTRAP